MTNQSLVKVDIGISDARSFWKLVVIPTMEEFRTRPSIHIAIALVSSLWHLHEWRWYDQHPEEDIGKSNKAEAYRDKLIEECPALGWLKDLTNISKHRALSRGKLKVKRQLEISGRHGAGGYGLNVPMVVGSGKRELRVYLGDGSAPWLDDVVEQAFAYWSDHFQSSNAPSP